MEFSAIPTDHRSDVMEITGDIVFKKIVVLVCWSYKLLESRCFCRICNVSPYVDVAEVSCGFSEADVSFLALYSNNFPPRQLLPASHMFFRVTGFFVTFFV